MVPWDDNELDAKEGNDRLRWNLVFNILLLTVIPAPIWLPFASMELAVNILPILQMLLMSCWLVVTFSAWVTYIKLLRARNKVFQPHKTYEHLVVISTYKEPTSLLISTIESIELQEPCRDNVNLTLSFEEQGYIPMSYSILIFSFQNLTLIFILVEAIHFLLNIVLETGNILHRNSNKLLENNNSLLEVCFFTKINILPVIIQY